VASLLAVAGRIACHDVSRFEACSCPWTSVRSSTNC